MRPSVRKDLVDMVDMIETTPLLVSLSNLADMLKYACEHDRD